MSLEQDIAAIKARNKRVEADKAWETSRARKCAIIVFTYILATIVMWWLGVRAATILKRGYPHDGILSFDIVAWNC